MHAALVATQIRERADSRQATNYQRKRDAADRVQWQVAGRIEGSTGRLDPADLSNPRVDDVLDDLSALVESVGGEVHVLAAERMPCLTGAVASFRH